MEGRCLILDIILSKVHIRNYRGIYHFKYYNYLHKPIQFQQQTNDSLDTYTSTD